jgi:hypothetical protein
LILALSILDGPEYIRCIHLGLCEFLELHGHLSNDQKSDLMENHSYKAKNIFFPIFEDLIDNKELIKNLIIFFTATILTFLKFLSPPIKRKTPYLLNIAIPSFSIENSIPLQTLKLLEISVIRS